MTSDPYSSLISQFITKEFPRKFCGLSTESLDLVTDEVLGTKSVRYGPKPNVESQVAIRDVLRHWIAQKKPVPFMVPWGSEKPDGSSVDIAELSALKQMKNLAARIAQFYEPGAVFNVRLEDASAPHLFSEEADIARTNAARYVRDFRGLVAALRIGDVVRPVPESSLITEAEFNRRADANLGPMESALRAHLDSHDEMATDILQAIGWTGGLNMDTTAFYLAQYGKLYPNKTYSQRVSILARYFAGALARRQLKIRGDDPSWEGKFLDLAFMQPTPGTEGLFNRRVHYRTMPSEFTSQMIAPWRAKGYLKLSNDNEVCPKVASFGDASLAYNEHYTDLGTVQLRTDYVLA